VLAEKSFVKSNLFPQLVNKSQAFLWNQRFHNLSQDPATCTYPEPEESSAFR